MLAVGKNFVELICFDQPLHDLILRARSLEDFQSHLWVVLSEQISQFVALSQLILAHPILDQVNFAGREHRSCQLQRLNLVQFGARFEQRRKVDHDRFLFARCRLHLPELVNGFLAAKQVRRRITSDSSSTCEIPLRQTHIELLHKGFVGTA